VRAICGASLSLRLVQLIGRAVSLHYISAAGVIRTKQVRCAVRLRASGRRAPAIRYNAAADGDVPARQTLSASTQLAGTLPPGTGRGPMAGSQGRRPADAVSRG